MINSNVVREADGIRSEAYQEADGIRSGAVQEADGIRDEADRNCSPKLMKDIVIEKKNFSAMCDTGSDVTCINEECFKTLGRKETLSECACYVTGTGKTNINVLGVFDADISIDGDTYKVTVLVLPNQAMDVEVIIGLTTMSQALVSIDAANNKVVFVKRVIRDMKDREVRDEAGTVGVASASEIEQRDNDNFVVDSNIAIDVSDKEVEEHILSRYKVIDNLISNSNLIIMDVRDESSMNRSSGDFVKLVLVRVFGFYTKFNCHDQREEDV